MKVAKKVRLLEKDKDSKYVKNKNFSVLRSRAVVQDEVVQETEDNYKDTGILYIIDEEATKEWLEAKKPKKKVTKKTITKTETKE